MDDKQFVVEPEKRVPVVRDVDVVVAGAGISGVFAAIASARDGAETLLVDRLAALGGNMGPGMIIGGFLYYETAATLGGDLFGIPRELKDRLEGLRNSSSPNYPEDSTLISHLASTMLQEAGGTCLLSSYATNPIMQSARVGGLFVENSSGHQAIRAKITIDATGEAALAARAGAPMIHDVAPDPHWEPFKVVREKSMKGNGLWNSTGLYMMVGGVDPKRCEDLPTTIPSGYIRTKEILATTRGVKGMNLVTLSAGLHQRIRGIVGVGISVNGEIDCADGFLLSQLESAIRAYGIEFVAFLREKVAGFQNAFVLTISPFLGARGGPCIDGEYTLSVEDFQEGSRFDDVLYINYHEGALPHLGAKAGCDVPYRCLLPKKIDGLLVTGRGAAYIRRGHDPTGMRARPNMMVLGQACGAAAALAAREGVAPRNLDIRHLQQKLLADGFTLGDEKRLTELGLSTA